MTTIPSAGWVAQDPAILPCPSIPTTQMPQPLPSCSGEAFFILGILFYKFFGFANT
jgi:hypothetical protein